MRLAIMQGRLLPPVEGRFQAFPGQEWPREFELAAQAGLDAIELIYESFRREDNPLASPDGVAALERARADAGVAAVSVCADRFMEQPVHRVDPAARAALAEELRALLARCGALGIERVVLPFVDASRLASREDEDAVVAWIDAVLPAAAANDVELHLETDLAPGAFAALLTRLDPARVKANYDTGNSASLGYDAVEEAAAYGERIGSVHVKDRVRGGGTVPLGDGDADLPRAFAALRRAGYDGDVVLQVARDRDGDEVAWAQGNATTVRRLWEEAA